MALIDALTKRISRGNTTHIYAAQIGLYGHEYRANEDGSSGTDARYCCIQALEETVISYRDVTNTSPRSFSDITIPAGDEIVGLLDSVTITSGNVRCYFAGF